ncbi:MAG: DoxX family protein [Terracidiphilus sp.]
MMNSFEWFAQILLAGIFLVAGFAKIFSLEKQTASPRPETLSTGYVLPRRMHWAIALVEISGALALLVPLPLWRPDFLPRLAAGGLALLALAACDYRHSRRESAAPTVALLLLALFVIVAHS